MKHFNTFLESLKTDSNKKLLEVITLGHNAIFENLEGMHFVSVDIQADYASGFGFDISDFTEFLNQNFDKFSRLTFLFNGPELGFPDENAYKYWLYENGLKEEVLDYATFYDKGYAFFRSCMDQGGDTEELINLVKFMISKDVNDSRDMDDQDLWDEFQSIYGGDDIRELMELSEDAINIPELMSELQGYSNIVLTGGGINECLKEVEIALDALGKPYNTFERFTY
jgi:hypothetical protein